jgi:hypothetical protein
MLFTHCVVGTAIFFGVIIYMAVVLTVALPWGLGVAGLLLGVYAVSNISYFREKSEPL